MAAVYMDEIAGGQNIRDIIGTAAEIAAFDVTGIAPGSTAWATDTNTAYVLDGTKAWKVVG